MHPPSTSTDSLSSASSFNLPRPPSDVTGDLLRQNRMLKEVFGVEPESPPICLGNYVLRDQLGAGGMGVVYLAFDMNLERKVAIKKLHRDLAGSEILDEEAKSMARVSHPNVVTVHELRKHDDTKSIIMEYVDGVNLAEWLSAVPRTPDEVLGAFIDAGRGLAAVHEQHLVHHDFKPANVLVGNNGRVQVTDFGLVLRGRGGTRRYMSPEQAAGESTNARSDQYSFCVSLWEALCGEHPVDEATGKLAEPPPGCLQPWQREVLERGLDIDPDQRWPSMEELLDALMQDPRARRRKGWMVVFLLSALTGIALGIGTQINRDMCKGFEAELTGIWDAWQRERVEAGLLATGLPHAQGTWERISGRIDDYASKWVAARQSACEEGRRGEHSSEVLDRRMACLNERRSHLRATVDLLAHADEVIVTNAVETVAKLPSLERCSNLEAMMMEVPPPEDPAIARRVERIGVQLAELRTLEHVGKYDDALEQLDELMPEIEDLSYAPIYARALVVRGAIAERLADYASASESLELGYVLALRHRMFPTAAHAASVLLFVVGERLGRYDEGRRWAIDAEALAQLGVMSEVVTGRLANLGALEQSAGNYARARELLTSALEELEHQGQLAHPSRGSILMSFGNIAESEGDFKGAREYFLQAFELRQKMFGEVHPLVAECLSSLGSVELGLGNYEKAREFMNRSLEMDRVTSGDRSHHTARGLGTLATLHTSQGDYARAQAINLEALSIFEELLGANHLDVGRVYNNLGSLAFLQGKRDEAQDYFERAVAIIEAELGAEHPELALIFTNLGLIAQARGDFEAARSHYTATLAIQRRSLAPEHIDIGVTLTNIGVAAQQAGALDEARHHHRRALKIFEQAVGRDHPYFAFALNNLGEIEVEQGNHAAAADSLRTALDVLEASLGPEHPQLAHPLTSLARVALEQDQLHEAIELLERAKALRAANDVEARDRATTDFLLARALRAEPRTRRAQRRRARELAERALRVFLDGGPLAASDAAEVVRWLEQN